MIYYFSGTGNSQWAAETMAKLTDDTTECLAGLDGSACDLSSIKRLGIVFPIYAWDAPKLVKEFLRSLSIPQDCYCYAVCTCGEDCGNAMKKLKKTYPLKAALSISMPNNYVQGWDIDDIDTQRRKIAEARGHLADFATQVLRGEESFRLNKGRFAALKSSVASFGFSHFAMTDKPFYAEDTCNACGLCAKLCPTKNIVIQDGKPVWQGNCTQCLACLHRCPKTAIQYGKATKTRGRYYFGKNGVGENE